MYRNIVALFISSIFLSHFKSWPTKLEGNFIPSVYELQLYFSEILHFTLLDLWKQKITWDLKFISYFNLLIIFLCFSRLKVYFHENSKNHIFTDVLLRMPHRQQTFFSKSRYIKVFLLFNIFSRIINYLPIYVSLIHLNEAV